MPETKRSGESHLESVSCDLCGSSNEELLMTLSDLEMREPDEEFRLVRCRRCDLIYLNPRPTTESIGRYYPDTYSPFARRGLSGSARIWLDRRNVRELQRFLEAPNQVLDIGCGTGELLNAVRLEGNPNVEGIEPSERAARIARTRFGLIVRTGTLDDVEIPPESVDTVLLSHVLEHLPSPLSTMRQIERLLKPGGTLIIWVPNARSLAANWLGPNWMGWDVPRHLYSFTPGTLHRLLTRAGLRPVELAHERHGLEWAWGIRLWARSHSLDGTVERILQALHPALAASFTPLGSFCALLGKSGRIRMIARKPVL